MTDAAPKPVGETPADRRARILARMADQAMAAADKIATMIDVTDSPVDVIALNRELSRVHRSTRQALLVEELFERNAKAPPREAPRLTPDARHREATLRRGRMRHALDVRLDREGLEGPERETLEAAAEAWFAEQAIGEAFTAEPGEAVMARLVRNLGLDAPSDDDDDEPPTDLAAARALRRGSG